MARLKERRAGVLLVAATVLGLASALATTAGGVAAGAATAGRTPARGAASPVQAGQIPVYSHIVVVMEENRSYSEIIGSPSAPYINSLVSQGALFTNSFGVRYPSQPNYLALFAGSTFGVTSDICPQSFSAASLGSELIAAGLSYSSYAESMPSQGYTGCRSGKYYRKHNPTPDFTSLASTVNDTFAQFPADYSTLPTVSLVIPNLVDDMHSGTTPVQTGDTWLENNLNGYVQWAMNNNSLLILTWDTDDRTAGNHIPTLFVGAHITAGAYGEKISHYNVLRTIEQAYGLSHLGKSATATPITDVFGS